jgi:hypothetical protein
VTRRSSRTTSFFAAAGFAAVALLPVAALAWTQSADIETKVHGHAFSRVMVETKGCELTLRLTFDAPETAYKSESKVRNVFRFHARLQLEGGHTVETPVFQNTSPGARSYVQTKDTTAEACWAKEEHQLRAVDVEGCRGAGCKPDPFK